MKNARGLVVRIACTATVWMGSAVCIYLILPAIFAIEHYDYSIH